jgi:hypothetical protein
VIECEIIPKASAEIKVLADAWRTKTFSTIDAFQAMPRECRERFFIRRTKEEMVTFDGKPLYPKRHTDTFSYDLTQGPVSEQALYDQTTEYLRYIYNRAKLLNKAAARLTLDWKRLMLLIAEYKELQRTQYGHNFIAKHMPDFPLLMDDSVF